jgi:hypothetical protein
MAVNVPLTPRSAESLLDYLTGIVEDATRRSRPGRLKASVQVMEHEAFWRLLSAAAGVRLWQEAHHG